MIEDADGDVVAGEIDELLFLLNRMRDAVVRTADGLSEEERRTPCVSRTP